jgi:hypothetical protein
MTSRAKPLLTERAEGTTMMTIGQPIDRALKVTGHATYAYEHWDVARTAR